MGILYQTPPVPSQGPWTVLKFNEHPSDFSMDLYKYINYIRRNLNF